MVLNILRSRKFARRILIAILILIILAFVLWGVGSMTSRPAPIGKIGGSTITAEDFVESRQGTMIQIILTYFTNYETMNNILRNRPMINYMAWERLILLDAARKNKIKISNADVTAFIAGHPLFQRNGVFSQEVYAALLRNPALSMSPRQFEELVRENLQVLTFRQGILDAIEVTDEELLKAYKMNNDKVKLSILVIDKEPFSKDITVSDEEVREAYDKNKERFFIPEKADVEYIEIPYNSPEEMDAVTERLEVLYPEVTGSALTFKTIASRENLRWGQTGPFSRDDVIPGITFFQTFQDLSFSMKEGQIGPPIFSAPEKGAAYIVRKISQTPQKPLEFEEVQEDLRRAIKDAKAIELARKHTDEIYSRLTEKTSTLEEEATPEGVTLQTVEPVMAEGYVENIGPARELVYRAISAGKGELVIPLIFQKGVFITRVDDIMPADESFFSEQKEDLRKSLLINKQTATMEAWLKNRTSEIELNAPLEEL